ncbi:bifunctional 4-hydroxy-2-oxoglutarate aldolase/2-dehydro-3-deoxy-phosphogluconate aldolase [Agromyces sp. Root81]|uniref:bifunctional 4-hydroxy-2-oxoglutarate aldolase/2-dehydro-3-deoxy-phosphogluconate aldolase n=1 Tax=Agromyces sp. Root81 TaxID=1736601 RepID=UPI000AE3470E|nr:bifunctional 4-hydroxy-2-oxoglutarate aldolase/2-dehydro-3-deoxy-phosphogluconate aldolase [Agromyces sp. Root81]
MNAADYFAEHLTGNPVMAIFRGSAPERTVELCESAWNAGVGLVEVPVQSPDALASFAAAVAAGRDRGKHVGAGTVLSVEQLERVVAMGATFTVAPGFDADVAQRAAELGVAHLPGVATSSEIGWALRSGCSWVKAFPAAELGTSWLRAQKGPFPNVSFVATGGITAANAAEYLAAGFSAVAVGAAFSSPESVELLTRSIAEVARA